jgi:hypothetical protein
MCVKALHNLCCELPAYEKQAHDRDFFKVLNFENRNLLTFLVRLCAALTLVKRCILMHFVATAACYRVYTARALRVM